MLVLGLDPGTATTGYGLINVEGHNFKVIEFDLIETKKDETPEKRLRIIYDKLTLIIDRLSPDIIAIEKIFFATNAKTAIRVGQAQGVMLLCAAYRDIPIVEYAPGTIKKMVAGNGRADKLEMQKSVRKLLGARVRSKKHKKTHFDNAADALAVAICHAYHRF